MTTQEAFTKMIHTRGVHKVIGVSSQYVRNKRMQLKNEGVQLTIQEQLLEAAGWKKTVQASWEKE